MQARIFWLAGGGFLAVQIVTLLLVLGERHAPGLRGDLARRRRRELAWTAVPASLVAALLLASGFATASRGAPPQAARPSEQGAPVDPEVRLAAAAPDAGDTSPLRGTSAPTLP